MFDNTITLNPSTHISGSTNASLSYERYSHPSDGAFRVSGTALNNPQTIIIKHDVRKGKVGSYQASSVRLSTVVNDTVTGLKHTLDHGYYQNLPIGTFANLGVTELDQAGRLFALIRDANTLNKLRNQET